MEEHVQSTVEHLFRHESAKLNAVLTRLLGPHNFELADDIIQDTLIKAMENWRLKGIPTNPTAWLFTVARNKTIDLIRKERHRQEFDRALSPLLKSEYSAGETIRTWINEDRIEDEQLRMMFICCHPLIPEEGQLALILKNLCGFGVSEIARAFVTNDETISKRLYRARQQFREHRISTELPADEELNNRLSTVLLAIYLLFNEGYHATHDDAVIREDLVEESLRLANMLVTNSKTRTPESLALLALLCFQAARLYSRLNKDGQLISIEEQNRADWNRPLIEQGAVFLREASAGAALSTYHLEAAIAYEHCTAPDLAATDWKRILELYNWLYQFKRDPIVALNRLIVYGQVNGPAAALAELPTVQDLDVLRSYHFYHATLGDWYTKLNDVERALQSFQTARRLTGSQAEKDFFDKRILALTQNSTTT